MLRYLYFFIRVFNGTWYLHINYFVTEGQMTPIHAAGQGSELYTADQQQATTSFPTGELARIQTTISEVGGKCVTTTPLSPLLMEDAHRSFEVE